MGCWGRCKETGGRGGGLHELLREAAKIPTTADGRRQQEREQIFLLLLLIFFLLLFLHTFATFSSYPSCLHLPPLSLLPTAPWRPSLFPSSPPSPSLTNITFTFTNKHHLHIHQQTSPSPSLTNIITNKQAERSEGAGPGCMM